MSWPSIIIRRYCLSPVFVIILSIFGAVVSTRQSHSFLLVPLWCVQLENERV